METSSASTAVPMGCTKMKSTRRTKVDVAAACLHGYQSADKKLEIINYTKQHGLRHAAEKYHVKLPKNIREWEEREEDLNNMAHMKGGHRKTLHVGKRS